MSASRPLRVVSVCRSLPTQANPSSGIFVMNRIAAMSREVSLRALQPVPYCPGVAPLPDWAREPERSVRGVRIEHAPMFYLPAVLKRLDGEWLRRAIQPRLARIRSETGVDVIDAHFGYPEGVGCFEVGRRLGIPTFVTVRGFESEFVARPRIGSTMIHALQHVDGCIAVSHFLKDFLVKNGVSEERIAVIHNAIDGAVFSHGERTPAREKLNIPAHHKVIVSVGHLVAGKRHHVVIEAIARMRRRESGLTLAIVGGPAYERGYPKRLEELVARHGLQDVVRFVGNIPAVHVAEWLRAADVFALGTAREGCCNAVLEALAVGTPVVTTPAGDNAFFVKNGENGMLVPIDDIEAMTEAIATSLDRSWDRVQIARSLAAQVGNWDSVASRVLDFFAARLAERKAA